VLAQLQAVAYKLSHGIEDLPFDGAPQETPTPLDPAPSELTADNPGVPTAEGDVERVRLFRRLVDEFLLPVQFRAVCRYTADELGEVYAWMEGGPVRPSFLPEARIPSVADPLAVAAEQEPTSDPVADPEPEPEPARRVPNRRKRPVPETPLALDPDSETPHSV